MKHEISLLIFCGALILTAASCGGSSPANNAGNINSAGNENTNVVTLPSPVGKPPTETVNNAPTIGPVVQKYYDALKNKDNAALRDTLTKDFVSRIEKDMKEDKATDLAAYMAKDEYRPGSNLEVRNEKIEGDKAEAEIRGGAYKNWTPFEFAKEDGKWKFTGGSPEVENMPKSNTSANSSH
jgi:hypothetical protein